MDTLFIPMKLVNRIYKQAEYEAPLEACGILSGKDNKCLDIFFIDNILKSHTRYKMEPAQLINAYYSSLSNGMNFLALYHSHPTGPAFPSPIDLQEINYPELFHIIFAPKKIGWEIFGYLYQNKTVTEVNIQIN